MKPKATETAREQNLNEKKQREEVAKEKSKYTQKLDLWSYSEKTLNP